jgi:hypothetical protein
VTESIGPPVVYSVAVHGDTYLMAGANKAVEKKVFRW